MKIFFTTSIDNLRIQILPILVSNKHLEKNKSYYLCFRFMERWNDGEIKFLQSIIPKLHHFKTT